MTFEGDAKHIARAKKILLLLVQLLKIIFSCGLVQVWNFKIYYMAPEPQN